jgi:DHA1 family inner membrane transport protein
MAEAATSRSWMIPVWGLFVAAFAVVTAELIIAGLLPEVAADLRVDIPTAGLLITGYALGVAIIGPVLALVTATLPRRALLLGLVAIFIVGNCICAISTSYWMLLGSRLVIACCHGLFFGVAIVMASRLAPDGRQTSAISVVVAGTALAQILGVPIGTAIGHAYGWRTSFWVIALMGVVALAVLMVLIPRTPDPTRGKDDFRAELAAATRPVVLLSYLSITLFMTGVFTLFAYVVPLMTRLSGVPESLVPWVLFGMGFLGFFGNLAGGRLGDWKPQATMIGILAFIIAMALVMAAVAHSALGVVATLLATWLVGFGFVAPVQGRILKEAQDAPNFASTLISTAFNVGIASGAALGGRALAAGWGYGVLPLMEAAFLGLSLCSVLVLTARDRRRAALPAAIAAAPSE